MKRPLHTSGDYMNIAKSMFRNLFKILRQDSRPLSPLEPAQ